MKVCIIYNIPQHYREGIWRKLSIDTEDDFKIYCDYIEGHSIKHISKEEIILYNSNGKLKIYPILKNLYIDNVLVFQRNLISLIFSNRFDRYIFLGDSYSISTWISLIYLKIQKRYVIIWTHGAKGGESFQKKIFLKCFYSFCNHLLLYGNYAKNILESDLKIKNKISVIYNSLDYENQLILRNKLKKTSKRYNQNYIIFIGRIEKRKRIDILIEAFNCLINSNKYSTLQLVIIGEGPLLKELKQQYSISNINFLGAIYDEAIVADYLYNAELLVSPGHVGLNVIHSLTYGTPVITHNNFRHHAPEFEAIIPDKTGNFFSENSIEDLCYVIKKWLKSEKSRDSIRSDCYNAIDKYYNPQYQFEIIKKVIRND